MAKKSQKPTETGKSIKARAAVVSVRQSRETTPARSASKAATAVDHRTRPKAKTLSAVKGEYIRREPTGAKPAVERPLDAIVHEIIEENPR